MSNDRSWESVSSGSIKSTVVAIDKDKNSQFAVKWAMDKLNLKDRQISLVHVRTAQHSSESHGIGKQGREPTQAEMQQFFLPYRSICARKGIRAKEVVLHDTDIAQGLSEYIIANCITTIVLGASSRGALVRAFKSPDVPTSLSKCAPDSCDIFVVSKGKVAKIKSSNESATPSIHAAKFRPQESWKSASSQSFLDGDHHMGGLSSSSTHTSPGHSMVSSREYHQKDTNAASSPQHSMNSNEFPQAVRLERYQGSKNLEFAGSVSNNSQDYAPFRGIYNSFSSGAGDTEYGHMTPPNRPFLQNSKNLNVHLQNKECFPYSMSGSSVHSDVMSFPSDVSYEVLDNSQVSDTSMNSASASQVSEIDDELRRLKQELKKITAMYNVVCQDASDNGDKVKSVAQEDFNQDDAKNVQETALAILEKEKLRCKAAVEIAQTAQRIAELESEKRRRAEMMFKQEVQARQKAIDALAQSEIRYRKYTREEIEVATNYFSSAEKVGEGGYGPVFKSTLDHTPVAIKVLRPDMSQGEKQFQREVDVLSCMRHPHMVILMGACPEYGCLVYEYMENGSLEDRLVRKNGTPPLHWTDRFRIAAEIATALNFLHRTRPEPLVHRDLKPANILLDKNYVSKISDVGLARLIPPSMADSVTQYHMTAAAGTFCYIDPEYQQTGMLGTKSDIYSLGVMLLQIITARPPMGLTHQVETAIESGRFAEILDPSVKDWPVEEALSFAKLALKCCELRRRDRPDLDSVILPELERLSNLGSRQKTLL